jgi:hypothetical protein
MNAIIMIGMVDDVNRSGGCGLPQIKCYRVSEWSPTGKARGTSMFFGGIRRSIPSYAQGFGGLSSSHSSTAIGRGLLRRRIKRDR